jgi:hypothetical protein
VIIEEESLAFEVAKFKFEAPPAISRARRVLIKPSAAYPVSYPVTTSRNMLAVIIEGIRRVSDADILILEGTKGGDPVYPVYQTLGYDFPRVLMLDVRDCICVEVDNPLAKPLAVPTFWVPNVILSSDYLITVAPPKIISDRVTLSITNLLSLLPSSKYQGDVPGGWEELYSLGIERVATDLYFTLPFDLGIVEARQKLVSRDDPTEGKIEEYGKVFIGEPYEVDCEAATALGIKAKYLNLIREAKVEFEA